MSYPPVSLTPQVQHIYLCLIELGESDQLCQSRLVSFALKQDLFAHAARGSGCSGRGSGGMTAVKSQNSVQCLTPENRGSEVTNEVAKGVTAAEVARRTCFAARRVPYSGWQRSSSRQLSFQAVKLRLSWREQSRALVERLAYSRQAYRVKVKARVRRGAFRGQAGSARTRGSHVARSRAWPPWRRAILNELGKAVSAEKRRHPFRWWKSRPAAESSDLWGAEYRETA